MQQGNTYGSSGQFEHHNEDPLVEFYDGKHDHTDVGQFVARYSLASLLNGNVDEGIILDSGSPLWTPPPWAGASLALAMAKPRGLALCAQTPGLQSQGSVSTGRRNCCLCARTGSFR